MTAVAARPAVTVRVRTRLAGWRTHLAIGLVTTAALAFYLWHAIAEHFDYLTTGYDLGIFDQALRAYAHFKAPMIPLKGVGYNIFGDHFHPIIALIAPLYWIWDNPVVLLVVQAVLIAASVPVVYRFTRRRTGETLSLVVAAAYAFGWPIQALIDFDFHEIAFGTPILAFAIDALDRRNDRQLIGWAVLLFFVREDLGIVVLLLALLRLAQRRRPRWPVYVLALGGLVAYVLTTSVIIPHFSRGTGFTYGNQYDSLGNNIPDVLLHIVTRPWTAIRLVFTPATKTYMLAYLFLPLALLPLRSRYVLLTAPLLAERVFNSRGNLWQPHFHYNALPWLILVFAAVDGADRIGLFDPVSPAARRLRAAFAAWLVAGPIFFILDPLPTRPTPLTKLRDWKPLTTTALMEAQEAAVRFLPGDVCVDATNTMVPHLTPHDWVTLPHLGQTAADFVALDLSAHDVGNDGPKPAEVLADVQAQGYQPVFSQDQVVVLQSPRYAGPTAACHPLGAGRLLPVPG